MVTVEQLAHDELQQLLEVLPPRVLAGIQAQDEFEDLLEIVLIWDARRKRGSRSAT